MAMVCVLWHIGSTVLVAAVAVGCCALPLLVFAQNPGQPSLGNPQPKSASAAGTQQGGSNPAAHRKGSHRRPEPQPFPAVETHPPDPPPPDWPVNSTAMPASVNWNGRNLTIAASNSTLTQILRDVSTATGVKVEGMSNTPSNDRIYGSYGPAPAREVLSSLLEGSGYNVLMIGDQGEGTPRELVLTSKAVRSSSASQSAQPNHSAEEDGPEEPEQPEPQPEAPPRPAGMAPQQPGPNRTPQQMMQEMQQRQLQQQQQQQPQPGTPPQNN